MSEYDFYDSVDSSKGYRLVGNKYNFETNHNLIENTIFSPQNEFNKTDNNCSDVETSTRERTPNVEIEKKQSDLTENCEFLKFDEIPDSPQNEIKKPEMTTMTELDHLLKNEIPKLLKKKPIRKKRRIDPSDIDLYLHNRDFNFIQKTNVNFQNYLVFILNRLWGEDCRNPKRKFYGFSKKLREGRRTHFIKGLFNRTIRDILIDDPGDSRSPSKDNNRKIIEFLEKSNKKSKLLTFMNMTYLEVFQLYQLSETFQNDLSNFRNSIKVENEEDKERIFKKYSDLAVDYSEFYEKKKGNKRTKDENKKCLTRKKKRTNRRKTEEVKKIKFRFRVDKDVKKEKDRKVKDEKENGSD